MDYPIELIQNKLNKPIVKATNKELHIAAQLVANELGHCISNNIELCDKTPHKYGLCIMHYSHIAHLIKISGKSFKKLHNI